jgi:hypothetical protein
MRFFLLMMAYGLFAITLETTLLCDLPASMLRFDFVLPAVAALAFFQERKHAVPVLVAYGLLVDIASSAPFGMTVLAYLVIYSLIRVIISKISFQEGLGLLFWVAVMSLAEKGVCALVLLVTPGGSLVAGILLGRAPAQALLDAAVGFVLVPILPRFWSLTWEKMRKPKGLEWRPIK